MPVKPLEMKINLELHLKGQLMMFRETTAVCKTVKCILWAECVIWQSNKVTAGFLRVNIA
jgi:hypothetical protein